MAINIREHELVPEHEKMDEKEVKQLLEKFGIEKENLPKMDKNDAVAKKMDLEPGDVVHIKRNSPTAGTADYYRVVVSK